MISKLFPLPGGNMHQSEKSKFERRQIVRLDGVDSVDLCEQTVNKITADTQTGTNSSR